MTVSSRNNRPAFDKVIRDIADYVHGYRIRGDRAWQAAHYCLIDSLGCAFEARGYPGCNLLLGPATPGTVVANGARVPGTPHELGVVEAAFNISTLIRWLDYNDAFYGETVIHPSDCLGGLLAAADWASRTRVAQGKPPLKVRDVEDAMIRAYEVMGCLALANGFTTRMRIDHDELFARATPSPIGCGLLALEATDAFLVHCINQTVKGYSLPAAAPGLVLRDRDQHPREDAGRAARAARGRAVAPLHRPRVRR
jgi:2-methylcitrate dehydratase